MKFKTHYHSYSNLNCQLQLAHVPNEHGVIGVDAGAGHFGEQPAGVTRSAEEEVKREELVG